MALQLTPRATAGHWSASLCGLPWQAGAQGPVAFDCWGLVRHVQQARHGRSLAHLNVAGPEWRSLRAVVQRSGWRRVADTPREGDVLLMLDADGGPHVGTVVQTPAPALLHALRSRGVQIDRLEDLGRLGLGHLQCWRHG